jgi:hypothetical protein
MYEQNIQMNEYIIADEITTMKKYDYIFNGEIIMDLVEQYQIQTR